MSIGHNPQYFKDPHQYNPDRWSTDKIDPFAQMPFGFGPRGCWGTLMISVIYTSVKNISKNVK